MKRKETVVREEFDKEGNLLVRETTTVEEDDAKDDSAKIPDKPYSPYGPLTSQWGGGVIWGDSQTNTVNTVTFDDLSESVADQVKSVLRKHTKTSGI